MLRHCRFYQNGKYVGFCQQSRKTDDKGEFYPCGYTEGELVEVERYAYDEYAMSFVKREFREDV